MPIFFTMHTFWYSKTKTHMLHTGNMMHHRDVNYTSLRAKCSGTISRALPVRPVTEGCISQYLELLHLLLLLGLPLPDDAEHLQIIMVVFFLNESGGACPYWLYIKRSKNSPKLPTRGNKKSREQIIMIVMCAYSNK